MRKEYKGMDFRHFYYFNLVMLGKQGWKSLFEQDVSVTKVFKVKYFSNDDFLQAKLGYNPNFTWCDIYSSRVVKHGMR